MSPQDGMPFSVSSRLQDAGLGGSDHVFNMSNSPTLLSANNGLSDLKFLSQQANIQILNAAVSGSVQVSASAPWPAAPRRQLQHLDRR